MSAAHDGWKIITQKKNSGKKRREKEKKKKPGEAELAMARECGDVAKERFILMGWRKRRAGVMGDVQKRIKMAAKRKNGAKV